MSPSRAAQTPAPAIINQKIPQSMSVDASLLAKADWWFNFSWYGILGAGLITAIAACATVFFLFAQFWSSNVRDRQSEWRTSTLESETTKAKADAAKATENAAVANERAAILETAAAEAKKETARLSSEAEAAKAAIAQANAETAKANESAAKANQVAESERLERIKLEARLAARSLSEQSRHEMAKQLRAFGAQSVDIFAYAEGSSPDTAPFAQTILAVSLEAGWKARYWTTIGGAGVVTGVVITTRDGSSEEIEHAADEIAKGLNERGLAASRWDQHFKTTDAKEIPGTVGVSGPTWDTNNVSPIRVLVGTKSL